MKNTNQQDRNDPHKVIKLAKEEWDQTDTQLAKYGKKMNERRAENYPVDMSRYVQCHRIYPVKLSDISAAPKNFLIKFDS
jgi:hypothetical protein